MPSHGQYGIDASIQLRQLSWQRIRQHRNADPVFAGRYFNPHVGVTWVDGETTNVKAANPNLAYIFPMQNPGDATPRQTHRFEGLHHIIVEIDAPSRRARAGAVSVSSAGAITAIAVYDGGAGYTAAPAVNVLSNAGGGAVATAIINAQGVVTGINVTAGGAGYKSAAKITVTINAPPQGRAARAGAINLSPTGAITGIAVQNGGAGYRQAPNVVIRGGDSNATATAVIDAHGAVTAINVTDGGSAYSENGGIIVKIAPPPPAITAKAGKVTVSAAGAITNIAVKKRGSRYTTAPSVRISSDAGAGATATTTINAQGVVTAINVTAGGVGYKQNTPILVTIDDPPPAVKARVGTVTLSAAGGITNIAVANGGAGYTAAPAVRIISGIGAGAAATAVIGARGVVTAININAAGAGYQLPSPDPDLVRKWGEIDAKATCSRVWDVVKGGELAFPDQKSVIVYLDIEWGVYMSPDYWYGWASTVYWFCTGFFQWPFYPGLYCTTQHNPLDSGNSEFHCIPSDDVQNGLTASPNSFPSRCWGIYASSPETDTSGFPIPANPANDPNNWPPPPAGAPNHNARYRPRDPTGINFFPDWDNRFDVWTQTVHVIFGLIPWDFSVNVLLWQYGMQSAGPNNPNPSPPGFNALDIDLDETSPDGGATLRMLKIP